MAGRDETMTTEKPGKAQTGRKKLHLRIGGPGILVGVLAVAVVVGVTIRIRRYQSLRKAKKRIQHSSSDDRSGGLRSVLQKDEDHPCCYTRDVAAEMVLRGMMEHVTAELGIEMEKIGENEGDEASGTDHGEWMAKEISESSAEGEDEEEDSANEGKDEEDYDEVTASEAEEEEDAQDEVAGHKAEENDDVNDDDDEDDEEEEEEEEEDDDKDLEECVVEKCEEGSIGTENSSMESTAEVVWPAEMKKWPLEIKEMKVGYQDGRIPKTRSYNFLYKVERRIPVKIKLKNWIWTTLMLLLLLLLSVIHQKTYVSLYY